MKRADVKTCLILQTFHAQKISGTEICVGDLAFKEIVDKQLPVFCVLPLHYNPGSEKSSSFTGSAFEFLIQHNVVQMNPAFSHTPRVGTHTIAKILLTYSNTVYLGDAHKMTLPSEDLEILLS